jgi:hypothetical protein
MFGPSFLAAPVIEPGATTKDVRVPRGKWVDFWRNVRFRESDGAFVPSAPASLVQGGRTTTLPAPIEELPLLVKAGAIVPMLPADIDTLAPYGDDDPEVIRLADRRNQLTLLAFPRGRSQSALGATGRAISTESAGSWRLQLDGKPSTLYTVRASLGALRSEIEPCSVTADGRPLDGSAWRFDAGTQTLTAKLPRSTERLVVSESNCQ